MLELLVTEFARTHSELPNQPIVHWLHQPTNLSNNAVLNRCRTVCYMCSKFTQSVLQVVLSCINHIVVIWSKYCDTRVGLSCCLGPMVAHYSMSSS